MASDFALYGMCPHCKRFERATFDNWEFITLGEKICPKCGADKHEYTRVVGRFEWVRHGEWWHFWNYRFEFVPRSHYASN